MKRRRFIAWAASALALVAACSERPIDKPVPTDAAARWAEVLCEREAACGCGQFETVDACVAYVIDVFDAAAPDMLGFDEACFEAHLQSDVLVGCPGGDLSAELIADCSVFHGRAGVGEPCRDMVLLSWLSSSEQCEVGLSCDDRWGVCVVEWGPSPPAKSEGDACDPSLSIPCQNYDLYCDGGTCQPRHPLGEPCPGDGSCEIPYFCQGAIQDGAGICAEGAGLGESCDPQDSHYNCKSDQLEGWSWCNPATATCEVPLPRICGLFWDSQRREG